MSISVALKVFRDCFRIDPVLGDQAAVLTVAGDNSRNLLYKGKYYSPLVDTLQEDLGANGVKSISVARIISNIKGDRSYGKVYAPDGGFARALAQKRLLALFAKGRYPFSTMEESLWGRILDSTRARRVVAIQPSRELCVACHKRNVWVSDLQHGVIADLHPWYGREFRSDEPRAYLPDAFLCWDFGAERVIAPWARPKGIATMVIGHPWLRRFGRPEGQDPMVDELCEAFERESPKLDGRKVILISLSWGEVGIPNGFICNELIDVIKASARTHRWLIRLHPNQLRGFAEDEGARFMDFFRANLEGFADWQYATSAPLPVVLRNTDMHISWTSSVCIEAALMGIKSALLNPMLRASEAAGEYFGPQRQAGMVDYIEATPVEIQKWIERNNDSKAEPASFSESETAYRELIDFLCAGMAQ